MKPKCTSLPMRAPRSKRTPLSSAFGGGFTVPMGGATDAWVKPMLVSGVSWRLMCFPVASASGSPPWSSNPKAPSLPTEVVVPVAGLLSEVDPPVYPNPTPTSIPTVWLNHQRMPSAGAEMVIGAPTVSPGAVVVPVGEPIPMGSVLTPNQLTPMCPTMRS